MQQSTTQNTQGTKRSFDEARYPLIEINRKFNAPAERLFKAFTSADSIKQWWGPETYSCPYAKMGTKAGDQTILGMQGPDGKIVYSGGPIEEIIPNEKLVVGDMFMDKEGNEVDAAQYGMPGDWPKGGGRITMEFLKLSDNESQLNLIHQGIPKDMHDDCIQGWNSSIDKLQKFVEHS